MEKQDDDTMFLWNGSSLFNTEENAFKSECTPTGTKDTDLAIKDNAIISKIKKLQENVKRQVDVNIKDKTPKVTTVNQETKPISEPVELVEEKEGVDQGNNEEIEELKEDIPSQNQQGGEDIEPGWEEKAETPPFLLTLEMLNHNVHNFLVDSGSSVNVMPLEVCKNINGQPESTAWEVVQLDSSGVKVVGEMKNVLIRL